MREHLARRPSAGASLLLDANKPLTFRRVPALMGTRGAPKCCSRLVPPPSAPKGEGSIARPPSPKPQLLQLELAPNGAIMSGLHLTPPHALGKEGPVGSGKDHTWQLLIATRPPVTVSSSLLLKRLLITRKPVAAFRA